MTENVVWHRSQVTYDQRCVALSMQGAIVWFTGLSGSGKSTIAVELDAALIENGQLSTLLDGDNIRHGLNADLGFGEGDRIENLRRVREVALIIALSGGVAIVPVISPYRASRNEARAAANDNGIRFVEVFVDTPLELCEQRDPKGLYKLARSGEITDFTGLDAPYEAPQQPEVRITPKDGSPQEAAATLVEVLQRSGSAT